ncbi:MAG: hypothetical protein RLY93_01490 [Sumerlaeia bacterium]
MSTHENYTPNAQDLDPMTPEPTGQVNGHSDRRDRAEEIAAQAREKAVQASERARDLHERYGDTSLKDVERSVGEYIRREPGKSLLIAAGVGALFGMYVRGGRH